MSTGIRALPFDIVHAISILLDIRSYINLGRASKHFYRLLRDESSARNCLERNIPYNRDFIEFIHAGNEGSAFQTLSLVFDQLEALRTAAPYSVSTLAYGTHFIYKLGTLCYISGDEIRVLDIYHRSRQEQVISGRVLAAQLSIGLDLPNLSGDLLRVTTLLGYADHILVFLCEEVTGPGSWLIALDIRDIRDIDTIKHTVGPCSRLRLHRRLASKTKLFVRHNRDYLYYGTHSAVRDDGHHEWLIQGCNLNTGRPISPKSLRLYEFVGSEVGSNACFEIVHGHFYALSNQTSFDTEEVDWTSCYHYVRFRLDEPAPDLNLHKIWRRQHHEGPINDAWTELCLNTDEQTNRLNIVEVRKEWLGGGSLCTRTAYTTPFTESHDEDLILARPNFPSNDQLSRTLDEHSKPSWLEKPPLRIPKFSHHEHNAQFSPQHEFIRARTKHHNYNSAAHAFLDLAADEMRIPNSVRSKDLLRLRIASRLTASPLLADPSRHNALHLRPELTDHSGTPIPGSDESFTPTTTAVWPPPHTDTPAALTELLCPGGRLGTVHAVPNDTRSLVYIGGSPNAASGGQRAIVLISFDPGWGHGGLVRLRLRGERTRPVHACVDNGMGRVLDRDAGDRGSRRAVSGAGVAAGMSSERDGDGRETGENGTVAGRGEPKRAFQECEVAESSASAAKRQKAGEAGQSNQIQQQRLLWTEQAMYLRINHGFWLR